MTHANRRTFATSMLFAAVLLSLVAETLWPGDSGAIVFASGHVTGAMPVDNRDLGDLAGYSATLVHPLFYPNRLPPVPQLSPQMSRQYQPPSSPFPSVTLLAVIINGQHREAVLRAADDTSITLAEGQSLGGWTLKQVSAERAVFELGGVRNGVEFGLGDATQFIHVLAPGTH